MPEKKKATRKAEEKREAARLRDLPEKRKASDEQAEKVKGGKIPLTVDSESARRM